MATVQDLIKLYNAEQVGDRLIAVVDGKREYIADVGSNGFMLTAAGMKLEHDREAAAEAKAKEPKAKAKAKAADAPAAPPADDGLGDLDGLLDGQ